VRHFRRFISHAQLNTVQVLLPVPLPGTELTHRLRRQNRIYSKDYLGWEYYDGNFPLFVPDEPMAPEEMQASIRLIMGRFYRFKHMFHIGWNILSFPMLFFYLHNIRRGWSKWYYIWQHNITRFGGWLIIRRWANEFKKDKFPSKLEEAKKLLVHS